MWERFTFPVVKFTQAIFLWLPILFLSKFFLRLRVYGWEHLYNINSKAFIIGSNHVSYLDAYLIADILATASVRRFLPVFAIMEDRYFQNIFQKWLFLIHGAFPAKKGLGLETSSEIPIQILKKGGQVIIFPTAGLIRKGKKRNPRRGIAYIASKTDMPIIPLYIYGFNPDKYLYGFSLKELFLRKRNIIILIGNPFYIGEVVSATPKTKKELRQTSERIMERVNSLKNELIILHGS